IIVINDGSPDGDALESRLANAARRINYIKQANAGPGGARNTGIRAARGQFIAFLDADDYWTPDYLSEQMKFLREHPNTDMVYTDALIVGETPLAGHTFMQETPSRGDVTLEGLLDERCTIILSGVVARRRAIVKAGMFDENFRQSED